MNLAELTAILNLHPQGLRVMVDGYESGYEDLEARLVQVKQVQLDTGDGWWAGRHQNPEDVGTPQPGDGPIITALVLGRPTQQERAQEPEKPLRPQAKTPWVPEHQSDE